MPTLSRELGRGAPGIGGGGINVPLLMMLNRLLGRAWFRVKEFRALGAVAFGCEVDRPSNNLGHEPRHVSGRCTMNPRPTYESRVCSVSVKMQLRDAGVTQRDRIAKTS